MRSVYKIVCLFLCLQCINSADIKLHHNCKNGQRQLADAQSHFVLCTVDNSVPFEICNKCVAEYDRMEISYNNIASNPNCTEEFFDKDRINLMSTMQGMLKGLWVKAYCSDCFNSNNSDIFADKWNDWDTCVEVTKSQVCLLCEAKYIDLNSFYKSLDINNRGKVCYDLQDKMNRTRSDWSNRYNCCKREKHFTFYLIATGIFSLIPFIFYGGAYVITKRQERNHGLLNEHEPGLERPSTETLIAAAIIATQPRTSSPPAASTSSSLRKSSVAAVASDKSVYAPIELSDSE